MNRIALVLALALFLVAGASGCTHQGVRSSAGGWTPKFKIHRNVLSNGLTVLFIEDHSVPIVSYATWFRVGSAWEKRGSTGIAHLFEHMMFKGTARYPGKSFIRTLEGKGAVVNAYTQRDATVYYALIASQHLELVIDMESDRLANLELTQADLEAERQVVKAERRLRVDSDFGAQQLEGLLKTAFPTHPYGWPVVGLEEDLDRLSLSECRAFFRDYYQPQNALVVIAGDFDHAKTLRWMEHYYGRIPGKPVEKLKLPPQEPPTGERRIETRSPVNADSLLVGYYIPSMYSEDSEKIAMLGWALFGLSSSSANLKLVREHQLALGVGAEASAERDRYLFLVNVDLKTGVPAERALTEIDTLIEKAKLELLSEEELQRVKNRLIYATVNETKSVLGAANWLATGEFYWSDHNRISEVIRKYHATTLEDLREMAQKYLRRENRIVSIMRPEEGSK